MGSESPSSSKISQHLAKFAYEPGTRSPRRSNANKSAQSTPEKPAGGFFSKTSPKDRRNLKRASSITQSSLKTLKRESLDNDDGFRIDNDGVGESTLESIESSDMSEIQEPAPKRRRQDGKEKPKKVPRGYAPPEVYAHLEILPDQLREGLDVIFSGINPGKMSATLGHHFAHPTNKFWPALYKGGFTDKPFTAMDDHLMPDLFNFGLTNLVPRPTSEAAELSAHEMRLAVPSLLEKIKTYRPGLVCFVGKGIWDKFADIVGKASEEPEVAWVPFELRLPEEDAVKEDVKPEGIKMEEESVSVPVDQAELPLGDVDIKPDISNTVVDKKRKTKPAFDWTQPRNFKLVHPARTDNPGSVTLFWVVPSTSGLERTPREDLWRYFGLAKAMSGRIKQGSVDTRMFREIKLDRVYEEVEKIKRKAEDKARKSL